MTSLLDLPPELVNLILWYLQRPGEPPVSGQGVRKRPALANGGQIVCPCIDDERVMRQLLTCVGKNARAEERDIVRFGLSHPYIEECIELSRCCEMVDAYTNNNGVIRPFVAIIPSIVQ